MGDQAAAGALALIEHLVEAVLAAAPRVGDLRQLKTLMEKTAGVRRAGAAALDLAYVACGRLDAFWELGLSAWDMAAGALLIQEAGGLVADPLGEADFMQSGDICAATPKIFPQFLEALK